MKKSQIPNLKSQILLAMLFLWLVPVLSHGASTLPVEMVWEFRRTGSYNNGGGFNSARSGTDYSQQDTAQLTVSDLACASSSTTCTSSTGGFTDAMKGNAVKIYGGSGFNSCTATGSCWYEIVSRTDTNTIVVDRAPSASGGSGGTASVGGALNLDNGSTSMFYLFDWLPTGSILWFKKGDTAYPVTGDHYYGMATGQGAPQWRWRGYNATRGDMPAGDNRPAFTISTYQLNFDQNTVSLEDIIFNVSHSYGLRIGPYSVVRGIRVNQTGGSSYPALVVRGLYTAIINSEFTAAYGGSPNGAGIQFHDSGGYGYNALVWGNYIHDCAWGLKNLGGLAGASWYGTANVVAMNVFTKNTTHIDVQQGYNYILHNTFYGGSSAATTGISATATNAPQYMYMIGNIFKNLVTAMDFGSHSNYVTVYSDYNDFHGNTTDRVNVPAGGADMTLDPQFQDAENGNFAIGANLKAKGIPGLFGSNCTGYLDIGAVQRQEGAGLGSCSTPFVSD